MSNENGEKLPEAFQNTLDELQQGIVDMQNVQQPFDPEAYEKLTPLEKANADLFGLYTLNSMYFAYLRTMGEDPKNHPIMGELARIQERMTRASAMLDRQTAMKLDVPATQRVVRHSLWEPKAKKSDPKEDDPVGE